MVGRGARSPFDSDPLFPRIPPNPRVRFRQLSAKGDDENVEGDLVESVSARIASSVPSSATVSRQQFMHTALAASLLVAVPSRPAEAVACLDGSRRVIDEAGYLPQADYERLERILAKLEIDTGYGIRVLSRTRARFADDEDEDWTRAPPASILRCAFNVSAAAAPTTVLIVADRGIKGALEAGSSFLTFPFIGESVQFLLPGVYWSRLQRQYGRRSFVESGGEAASIMTACELILTCLRNEEGCTDVPPPTASFF